MTASAAGAESGSTAASHQRPWGMHRQGGFCDPFVHSWSVGGASPLRRMPARGG